MSNYSLKKFVKDNMQKYALKYLNFSCDSLKLECELSENGLNYTDLVFGTMEEKHQIAAIFFK